MENTEANIFLGRQPILDREQSIVGYELLFRSANTLHANIGDHENVDSFVISNVLSNFGIQEVLGKHKGFINVTGELLMGDLLQILPREQTVIEILETVELSDALLHKCRELKERGFTLALDDNVYHPDYEPLYEIVDIVKIDVLQVPADSLKKMVDILRTRGLTLLAEKVETIEQYHFCRDLGFDLFQGYYFARPAVLNKRKVDVSGVALLKLLELICKDAEITEIEEAFKHNPNLTYNLLRLVNSVVIGMKEKIRTLRHALVVLGLQQLKRWIQLALYASDKTGSAGNPLLESAATRGRLMEILVKEWGPEAQDHGYSESAFMTGVLSLVDVLLGAPMEEILAQLNLAEEVRLALLERKGTLGSLLLLTEKLENLDFSEVSLLLNQHHCSRESLITAQLEAIDWTNSLDEAF
ncbi:MAG: EAL domain-containing protein [Deltaproteobacteria bacterium]|nr:EAL domain-containing protein [Deltaproteobacteria bacterium]